MKINYKWNLAELIARIIIYMHGAISIVLLIIGAIFGIVNWFLAIICAVAIIWALWFARIPFFELKIAQKNK